MERKPCPFCGAKGTNRGKMLHHGPYHGYACRSWTSDDGQHRHRSEECIQAERREGADGLVFGAADEIAINPGKRRFDRQPLGSGEFGGLGEHDLAEPDPEEATE